MLAESINDSIDMLMVTAADDLNRYVAVDMFSTEFLNPRMSDRYLDEIGLDNIDLGNRTTDEISRIVSYFKKNKERRKVGLAHYLFGDQVDIRAAFDGFKVIDVIPTTKSVWLVRILQIRKSAMRKSNERIMKLVDDTSTITKHLDEKGWYPEWWLYNGIVPFEQFLELEMRKIANSAKSLEEDLPRLTRDSDIVIDSNAIVFDNKLSWLPALEETLGISFRASTKMRLRNWVSENKKIIKDLNLGDLESMDPTGEDVRKLVSDRLIAAYNRMEW